MKLSDLQNLMPGVTVPTENPVRDIIRKTRGKDFKTALRVALKDKKTGNPAANEDPNAKSGGEEHEKGTVDV